ncbi:MAG TPA: hypothetical protein ENH13_03210 [Euryarchaeota archaeon]|nr:hypothetical protein [Euryarchaeota archaeon]
MNSRVFAVLVISILFLGCVVGSQENIRLKGAVDPGQISLDKDMPVSIEATVENIGNSTETVAVDVDGTEGLVIERPERRSFTLKPGESRVVIFVGRLEETAVPGKYRVEIVASTDGSASKSEVVFLNVVSQQGFI